MKLSFRPTLPQIVAFLAAAVAALAMREFLRGPSDGGSRGRARAITSPIVGDLQSLEGQVTIRPPRGTSFEPAHVGPLHAESVVQTQAASAAVIEFRPGPTLRLLENSRIVAEVDPSRDGVIQATLLAGEVTVLNAGSNSLFTLLHNGLRVPLDRGDSSITRTVPLIRVGPTGTDANAGGDLEEKLEVEKETEMGAAPSVDLESAADSKPHDTKIQDDVRARTLPAKSTEPSGLLRSTLTNDDIRTQVKSQAGSFQKCYVAMVNRMSEKNAAVTALPKGEIMVSFKIQPTGKVEDPNVLRSPFKDATFERCIGDALSRMRFRQFQGAAIPVGEFPITLE